MNPTQGPELPRLADATRGLIEATVLTRVDADTVAQAAELVERAAELVSADERDRPFLPDFDQDLGPHDFFPFNPQIGLCNAIAPPVRVEIDEDAVVGRARLGWAYQGPPGLVHGAVIAAVFDQVLSLTNLHDRTPGVTGSLTIRYRRPTPIGAELRFEARRGAVRGRRMRAHGRLYADEQLTAEAEGLFVALRPGQAVRLPPS